MILKCLSIKHKDKGRVKTPVNLCFAFCIPLERFSYAPCPRNTTGNKKKSLHVVIKTAEDFRSPLILRTSVKLGISYHFLSD